MIVINFTMIYMVTKVSSAILLANVGLLLGGFALTNIDKVMMIKKKENDANDDDYETLTLSQVKQLADIADSWLGGGGQVEGDGGGGDRLGDVVTKVVASSGFLSTIFQLGPAIWNNGDLPPAKQDGRQQRKVFLTTQPWPCSDRAPSKVTSSCVSKSISEGIFGNQFSLACPSNMSFAAVSSTSWCRLGLSPESADQVNKLIVMLLMRMGSRMTMMEVMLMTQLYLAFDNGCICRRSQREVWSRLVLAQIGWRGRPICCKVKKSSSTSFFKEINQITFPLTLEHC